LGITLENTLLLDAAPAGDLKQIRHDKVHGRPAWGLAALATLLIAIGPAVIWPGDVPWTNDEPILIVHAAQANQGMWLVSRGLTGSLGLSYGPLPTQIYQVLLLLTRDPCKLVALRGLLCAGVTGISLLWLARTLRFSPWFAAAVCLAPNVYLFHRILWDATFIIPIGTLAFAAYASFLQSGSRRPFLVMLASTFALPLIHPQTLPLFAALIGHLLWKHRPAVWKHRVGALVLAAALISLNAGYLRYAIATVLTHGSELVRTGQGTKISPFRAVFTPLLGGDILCGDPFPAGDSRPGLVAPIVTNAGMLARGVHVLVWLGIAVTALRVVRSIRIFPPPPVLRGTAEAAGDLSLPSPFPESGRVARRCGAALFPFPSTALKSRLTAIAVTLSAAKGLFCRRWKRSLRQAQGRLFAALRMTSNCVLERGVFHASRVSQRLTVTSGEGTRSTAGKDPHPYPPPEYREREKSEVDDFARSSPRDAMLGIALVALLLQMLLYALIRVPPMISYFFGPFPITVLFAWVGIEAFTRLRLRGAIIAIYGVCVATLTFAGAWQVHQFGWPRGSMSPTLGNQVAVARALNRYSDTSAMTNVTVYESYSHALSTLRFLLPPVPGTIPTHSGRLLIRYRTEEGSTDGRIELVEAGPAEVPLEAKRINLSPPR